MFNWFKGKKSKSRLGIDLGNFAIKIVELTKDGGRLHMTNYAMAQTKDESSSFKISEQSEAGASAILKALMAEAKIGSRLACISLQVDRTFSTVIEMPALPEQELAAAIPFEAQKYVPVPLDEVVLDWSLLPNEKNNNAGLPIQDISALMPETKGRGGSEKNKNIQILVVAVPKEIIERMTRIAKATGLEITSLEQESFSLARALVGNDPGSYLIIDLGRKSTDLIVIDQGLVKISHNIDTVSKENILMEIDQVVNNFQTRYNRKVSQCLLTGGRANARDVSGFLEGKLRIPVKLGNPFARISHESSLEPALKELGSQLAVAIGLAMREN